MQMQDEEREYQEFIAKTMKASKDFVDDYHRDYLCIYNVYLFYHYIILLFL